MGDNSAQNGRDLHKISFDVVERNILIELGVDRRIILKCIIIF